MNNQLDKYPAHEGIKSGKLLAWDEVDKTGVQYMCVRLSVYSDLQTEFSALLQRQQSDEGLIRELVAALENILQSKGDNPLRAAKEVLNAYRERK